MVTPAGKELLKNSINTAKFHNRILEENDMWRQWELEKGLTMMVSDDAIRKKGRHRCHYHEKLRKAKLDKVRDKSRSEKGFASHLVDSKKWDHGGFKELYPDEVSSSSSRKVVIGKTFERWDHSGFAELYPEEMSGKISKEAVTNKFTKREKKDLSSAEANSSSSSFSNSDEELWEEFRNSKRIQLREGKECSYSKQFSCDSNKKPKKSNKRWSHSGFAELYPDEMSGTSKKSKNRIHKKRKEHESSTDSSASDMDESLKERFKSSNRTLLHCEMQDDCNSNGQSRNKHKKRWKHCKRE